MIFLIGFLADGIAEFFPANSRFLVYFGPKFLLELVYGAFGARIMCDIVQPPKPTFFFNEI